MTKRRILNLVMVALSLATVAMLLQSFIASASSLNIRVTLNRVGLVTPQGVVTVYGLLACDLPVEVHLTGFVVQRDGQHESHGPLEASVWCEGLTPWTATTRADIGSFEEGAASAWATVGGCRTGYHYRDCARARVELTRIWLTW